MKKYFITCSSYFRFRRVPLPSFPILTICFVLHWCLHSAGPACPGTVGWRGAGKDGDAKSTTLLFVTPPPPGSQSRAGRPGGGWVRAVRGPGTGQGRSPAGILHSDGWFPAPGTQARAPRGPSGLGLRPGMPASARHLPALLSPWRCVGKQTRAVLRCP